MYAAALLLLAAFAPVTSPKCLTIDDGAKRIGDKVCVSGKVYQVERDASGNHILHFCAAETQPCPFHALVYPDDLRDVGDVRWLEGKEVEIHGRIRDHDGGAEMVLSDSRQLRGAAAKLPLIPKEYDVESRGHFSTGKSTTHKSKSPRRSRRQNHEATADGGQN